MLVSHSNWNELDGRAGYEANRKPGDPELADTHGAPLRRGLYVNLARISDLGLVHYLKTGIIQATREQRNEFVSDVARKPERLGSGQ